MEQYQNKEIECVDCKNTFDFTVGEQEFLAKLCSEGKLDRTDSMGNVTAGKVTPPKRCIECREYRKQSRG